jgi:hypothetical protein
MSVLGYCNDILWMSLTGCEISDFNRGLLDYAFSNNNPHQATSKPWPKVTAVLTVSITTVLWQARMLGSKPMQSLRLIEGALIMAVVGNKR